MQLAVGLQVMEQIVLLTAAQDDLRQVNGCQQQASTWCPLTKRTFLPGERGRPRWVAIWRWASTDVIERLEDRIRSICSRETKGFTGWKCRFTRHTRSTGSPGVASSVFTMSSSSALRSASITLSGRGGS